MPPLKLQFLIAMIASAILHDRDPLFTESFTAVLKSGGVECVKIPARSPNCNPHAERFVKTIKYECLNQFIFFGERHLRDVIKEFVEGRVPSVVEKGFDASPDEQFLL
jgi:hypothetical protein